MYFQWGSVVVAIETNTSSNCLVYALHAWAQSGFRGRVCMTHWGRPWPHFAWVVGDCIYHWRGGPMLPWWRQLWFRGSPVVDYGGQGEQGAVERHEVER
jgi:hypothetical protein